MSTPGNLAAACRLALTDLYGDDNCIALTEPVFSAAFERKLRRMTAHARGDKYHPLTRAAKVLLAAVAAALLLFASAAAAKQYGFKLINFGTEGVLDIEPQANPDFLTLEVDFIPEGFSISETDAAPGYICNTYLDMSNNLIFVTKRSSYQTLSFDTDGRNAYKKIENGVTYMVITDKSETTLIWLDESTGCLFSIEGNVNTETAFLIASNCK
ncbi:MAG: DUF4367 domain-containing protein [Clostridia bacterium]|nr:DUF4367 domain-containing protein [Clostridia bacterium]